MTKKYLTIKEASKLLGINIQTMRLRVSRGNYPRAQLREWYGQKTWVIPEPDVKNLGAVRKYRRHKK